LDRIVIRPANQIRSIELGETVALSMPAGDPEQTVTALGFLATESGTIIVETRSLDFDIAVQVLRVDDTEKPIAQDDDGGLGTDSRVALDVEADVRYVIRVRPVKDD
jgi:hypothetical protein